MTDTAKPADFVSDFVSRGTGDLSIMNDVYLGNTVLDWASGVVVFVLALIALSIFKSVIIRHMKKLAAKTKGDLDDAVIEFLEHISSNFYNVMAMYAAVQHLTLPSVVDLVLRTAFLLMLVSEVIKLIESVLSYALSKKLVGKGNDEDKAISAALMVLLRIILWMVGILLVLSNLGFNVNSLIASLGIGGLAISLALQPVLTDIFSSFSIALDKPFEEGDYIVCGDFKGNVKKIGLKTTRLVALQGEELVISNTELTNARLQNYKKMKKRRINFSIGVEYGTSPSQMKEIQSMIKKVIEDQEHSEYSRAHFFEFGDSNLNFEVVYFMLTGDYTEYMDTQQAINLRIMDELEKMGVSMAYPTRTVHMVKDA